MPRGSWPSISQGSLLSSRTTPPPPSSSTSLPCFPSRTPPLRCSSSSKSHDSAAGDGTTTVVVIAGALLCQGLSLLSSGIHPTVISNSLHKASLKAVDVLTAMAIPVELSDRESLVKSANTRRGFDSFCYGPCEAQFGRSRDIKIVKKPKSCVSCHFVRSS